MKKAFVKPEIKSIRLRDNILAGSGQQVASCPSNLQCRDNLDCKKITNGGGETCAAARERLTFDNLSF